MTFPLHATVEAIPLPVLAAAPVDLWFEQISWSSSAPCLRVCKLVEPRRSRSACRHHWRQTQLKISGFRLCLNGIEPVHARQISARSHSSMANIFDSTDAPRGLPDRGSDYQRRIIELTEPAQVLTD